ncbi:MAG: hypothetical protein MJE63_20665, partial [Proteobacteria bacterium]|nr:hypothetical protein [Pseudomonadota bacterium]
LYSELDDVVSVSKIKEKYEQIGSPTKKLVNVQNDSNPSKHVLAGYILGNTTTRFVENSIVQFLDENSLLD